MVVGRGIYIHDLGVSKQMIFQHALDNAKGWFSLIISATSICLLTLVMLLTAWRIVTKWINEYCWWRDFIKMVWTSWDPFEWGVSDSNSFIEAFISMSVKMPSFSQQYNML